MKKLLLSSIFACAAFAQAPTPQAVGGALQQSTLDTINYLVSHQGGGGLPTGCTSPGTGAITCTGTVLAGAFGTGTSINILSTPALCAAVTTPAANTIAIFRDSNASNVLSMKISAGTCSAIGSTSTNGTSTQLLTSDGAGGYGTAVSQLAVVPQVFYPESYGALRDNSHDDTTAIQAAVTAAVAVHGTVRLQAGTYKTTAAITVPSQINIFGAGNTITSINNVTSTTDIITITGTDDNCGANGIFWSNLRDFNVSRPSTSSTNKGISLIDTCYISLKDVYSFNSKYDYYLSGAGNTHITSGYGGWGDATTATRAGYFFDSSTHANNSTILDGHNVSNGGGANGTGLLIKGACIADNFIYGFETAALDYGVWVESTLGSGASYSNCNGDTHLDMQIHDRIGIAGITVKNVFSHGVPSVIVTHGYFQSTVIGAKGVDSEGSSGVDVSSSQFQLQGDSSVCAYVTGGQNETFIGNQFQYCRTGILIDQNYLSVVVGNVFSGTTGGVMAAGISLTGVGGYHQITGNTMSGDGAGGITVGLSIGTGVAEVNGFPNTYGPVSVTTPATDADGVNLINGISATGTSCAITTIKFGIIKAATCTP